MLPSLPAILKKLATEMAELTRQLAASSAQQHQIALILDELRLAGHARRESASRINAQLEILAQLIEENAVVPLEAAPEREEQVPPRPEEAVDQQVVPSPPALPTKDERLAELKQKYPLFQDQCVLLDRMKLLADSEKRTSTKLSASVVIATQKLKDCTNTLYSQLHKTNDGLDVFEKCGHDTMSVLKVLTELLKDCRKIPGSESFRDALKPILELFWTQVQKCAPNTYERIELKLNEKFPGQRPRGLDKEEKYYDAEHEAKLGYTANELVEMITPGYLKIVSESSKSIILKAQVILASG